MKFTLVFILLFVSSICHPYEFINPEQAKAMKSCMAQFNNVEVCSNYSSKNKNCFQDFVTGKTVCDNADLRTRIIEQQSKKASPQTPKSPCPTAYFTANTQCNRNQLSSSQANSLLATIQSQKNAGNIKEACAAAQRLNSISWSLNTTFGIQCQGAIQRCLSACEAGSDENSNCKSLEQNVKAAQNQSIENAKSYAQSQECVAATSSCGSNSLDNPNCPQYCLKPGRQNDPLCRSQTSLAQTPALNNLPQPQTGNLPNETGKVLAAGTVQKEYDNSKNDLIPEDESLLGPEEFEPTPATVGTPANATTGSVGVTATSRNAIEPTTSSEAVPIGKDPTNVAASGGGSDVYMPSNSKGYPDPAEPEETEDKSWFDLRRFLPESKEEKMNKNMRAYNQRLLAEGKRNQQMARGKFKSTVFRSYPKTLNPKVEVEQARAPTSESLAPKPSSKAWMILSILTLASFGFLIKKYSKSGQ